jgi:hypothetical protein
MTTVPLDPYLTSAVSSIGRRRRFLNPESEPGEEKY